jgi:hypothetical protein
MTAANPPAVPAGRSAGSALQFGHRKEFTYLLALTEDDLRPAA